MTMKATIPAALLAGALVGAPAYAATPSGATTPESSAPKAAIATAAPAPAHTRNIEERMRSGTRAEEYSDRVTSADIAAFATAKVSLSRAITDAERDMHGKVVEAVFKAAPDQPHYVVC
jgi:hypothetical protein